jgi:hypothetical protein
MQLHAASLTMFRTVYNMASIEYFKERKLCREI